MKEATSIAQQLESKVRIRFEDCDPFGHLNNGRYIDYFMNAREDQLREHYQLDIYQHMQQTGNVWVVASSQVAYLQEVKLNEEVIIRTSLRWFTASDLFMEGLMLHPETDRVKAVVWLRFAYLNVRKGIKATHEPQLAELFEAAAVKGAGKPDQYFEERVRELRTMAVAE
ncbi:acyl-CoA thioesterase [Pontibacter chinhatensis]|uniref:Acyl-CoA thioester hydrolase n=1 Tax=Pontibacter chinhatensis TaxID=1436961 RepID=A0A1I2PJJ2_9BACT|nr:acyl-CoA thioesterase [Pontibacter chinhatensis]SFG15269.1 acyl-CoA thioester hydrolase [Pontibacter chinhatensis]